MAGLCLQSSLSALSCKRQSGVRQSAVPRSNLRVPLKRQQQDVSAGALALDWASTQTWTGLGVALAGLAAGVGIPAFFVSLETKDTQRLEELRELNRQAYKETGEYLTEEELGKIRLPRWTDRRQFEDDD